MKSIIVLSVLFTILQFQAVKADESVMVGSIEEGCEFNPNGVQDGSVSACEPGTLTKVSKFLQARRRELIDRWKNLDETQALMVLHYAGASSEALKKSAIFSLQDLILDATTIQQITRLENAFKQLDPEEQASQFSRVQPAKLYQEKSKKCNSSPFNLGCSFHFKRNYINQAEQKALSACELDEDREGQECRIYRSGFDPITNKGFATAIGIVH